MVIAKFLVYNKQSRAQFFEKTFLLIDTNMEVVLEMFFLFFSHTNLQFGAKQII